MTARLDTESRDSLISRAVQGVAEQASSEEAQAHRGKGGQVAAARRRVPRLRQEALVLAFL